MRSSKSRSRNKNRNNNRPMGNVVNRVFDSSGPEGKVRGTPQQIIDKYLQLHRDAQLSNDRVAAENFKQHAEHYARLLGAAMKEQEARREAEQQRQRERDEQRDAERDRQQTRDAGSEPQPDTSARPVATEPMTSDVVDLDGGSDSGLVETVENVPQPDPPEKPRRGRGRKPKQDKPEAAAEAPADTEGSDQPAIEPSKGAEAAE